MKSIDARGRSCPEPVLMTQNAITSNENDYEVLVDNQTAVQNVTRFAAYNGFTVVVTEESNIFRMRLSRK